MTACDSALLHLLRLPGVAAELRDISEVIPISSAQIILCFDTQETFLSFVLRQIEGLCHDPGAHDSDRIMHLHEWVRQHTADVQDLWVQAVSIRTTLLDLSRLDAQYVLPPLRLGQRSLGSSDQALVPVSKVPKMTPSDVSADVAPISLIATQELAAKGREIQRLKLILKDAGSHAKVEESIAPLGQQHSTQILDMVLGRGASHTLKIHVCRWLAYRTWYDRELLEGSIPDPFYPIRIAPMAKYLLYRHNEDCGPSVPDAFRDTIRFITTRLKIDCPDLADQNLLAIRDEVIHQRGRPLQEALPYPPDLIKYMEWGVLNLRTERRLLLGFALVMILGSLRFDDIVHVRPSSLVWEDDRCLRGSCWQTKVDRTRRGTHFVIPNTSFAGTPWLKGWYHQMIKVLLPDVDFWFPHFETKGPSLHLQPHRPAVFAPSLHALKLVIKDTLDRISVSRGIVLGHYLEVIDNLTWHSHRVTMIDLAARERRSDNEILLQMHSKDPAMVQKYTRSRGEIPAAMVFDLCQTYGAKNVVQQPSPSPSPDGPEAASNDEVAVLFDEDDACIPYFYHLSPTTITPAILDKLKYHIQSYSEPTRIECTASFDLGSMIAAGTDIPPVDSICKKCLARRPDLSAKIGLSICA